MVFEARLTYLLILNTSTLRIQDFISIVNINLVCPLIQKHPRNMDHDIAPVVLSVPV